MNHRPQKRGFVQLIIILALIVVIVSLLGVSLRTLFDNTTLQDNFGFVGEWVSSVWHNYLAAPFVYAWNNLLRPLFCTIPLLRCS